MDVQVDGDLIRVEREKRAWSQEHLAGAAGIGVRTIQRIEATGVASYESVRAICAALEMPVTALRADDGLPRPTPSRPGAPSQASEREAPRSDAGRAPAARLRFAARWLGAALALAIFASASGFFLLKDYKKVRVLRTVEHWVTSETGTSAVRDR